MKKLTFFPIILMFCLGFFATSCSDDDDDDNEPVEEPTGPQFDGSISYGVTVLSAQNVKIANKTASGLNNAVVALTQEGETIYDTTDADGLASFTGLKPGIVNGTVKTEGYANVFFTAELERVENNNDLNGNTIVNSTIEEPAGAEVYESSIIPMLPTQNDQATITGVVEAELDEDQDGFEPLENARIEAVISARLENNLGLESYILGLDDPASTVSNAGGEYTITVPPSTGFVSVFVTLIPRPVEDQVRETFNGERVLLDFESNSVFDISSPRSGSSREINFQYSAQ